MERTYIKNLKLNETQKIQGFVENIRNKKTMAFIVVRDATGSIQVTFDKGVNPSFAETLDLLTAESVVTLEGEPKENPYVKLNGREVIPAKLCVESAADAMPLTENASIDVRLDYRWIGMRSARERLMFLVQTAMTASMRSFLINRGFVEIHTPKLVGTASESGSDVFEVGYFDKKAYLAQSPQFYKQMAMAGGLERIFETGPVFRAEKSHTNRHAAEFTGFDVEFSYIESYKDVMRLEEEMLCDMLRELKIKYGDEISKEYGIEITVPEIPFPVITLGELYGALEKRYGYTVPDGEKGDMTAEAEQLSYRFAREVYNHEFLFVTDFSAEKRAFYHMRKNGVPQGYDLIWRGVEITTGAQREHRYDILKRQAEEKGLGEDVRFYTEFFRYGCPPHGGFGLGIDRLTMLTLGIPIKEAMFLFRGPNRLTP